jgi:DNA polymerase-1
MAAAAETLAACGCVAVWMGEALSLSDGAVEYRIPLRTDLLGGDLAPDAALTALAPVFESEAIKAVWDAKEWLHRLGNLGIRPGTSTGTFMIAGWLLAGGDAPDSAAALAEKHLGRALEPAPATTLWHLWKAMEEELARQGMAELYGAMERPLIGVLRDMETDGFPVDPAVLRELGEDMDRKLNGLTARIHKYAGEPFNINSTRQLGEVLFVKLGLPVVKNKKTGWSTDIEVLETLEDRHPIVPLIMEYRQLSKLKGTYIDGLLPLVGGDGRIRTRFVQTGTSTGRLSSAEPNLQNIPVRLPEGRQIRRAFVAGGPGRTLVDADYSQIELRVLAHMADDPGLIAAFLQGDDIHRRTASQVFGVPLDEVTAEMRGSAKAVNFGIIYGISDFGLSRQLGISRAQAGRYIDKYLNAYSGVRAFMERTLALGRERGYVETLFHRRRAVPGLTSGNYAVRSAAERMAMNAPIQGTAADIIKLAMIAVHQALERRDLDARLILQVHDELIVDAPAEVVQEVARLMKSVMEGIVSLKVPLITDVSAASNWYDAK